MRINLHHITYKPLWAEDISRQMHTCIGTIQNSRATEERYAILTNFVHAVTYEWNRMRAELQLKTDLRVLKDNPKKNTSRVSAKKRKSLF